MFTMRYDVRVAEQQPNGKWKMVWKKRFIHKDDAVNKLADKLVGERRANIRSRKVFVPEYFQNTQWDQLPHDPWEAAPKPISKVYIHHSVTTQLSRGATVAEERAQMESLDRIAHGRGFNGISYCWGVMPSSRCWEGRGFGIVEAGTLNHNTDGDSIVFVGNYQAFSETAEQWRAVIALIKKGQHDGFFVKSGLSVIPHRNSGGDPTSCPGQNITDADVQAVQRAVN